MTAGSPDIHLEISREIPRDDARLTTGSNVGAIVDGKTSDVLIVGAGIVGAAVAREAVLAGLKVTIVEPAVIGGGATAAGMGHIVVMDDSEAQFALNRYSQQLWDGLVSQLPADCEFERSGTVWVAADDEEMTEVRRKRDYYASRNIASEVLDERGLAEAEPYLRKGLAGGLLVPGDAVVYAPCVARWLVEQAVAGGAKLIQGKRVAKFECGDHESAGATAVLEDGTRLSAGAVVNAAGAGSRLLTEGTHIRLRKGHLVITDRYPGFVRHQLVELGYLKNAHSVATDSVAFNVQPRRTGQMLIGSSRQFDVEVKAVERHMLSRMLQRAIEYMPGLKNVSAIRTWTGFRAATPDNLPLVGPAPGEPGMWLATGHEGLGITTSMASGRLLVDQLVKRQSVIPVEPYLPERLLHPVDSHR